MSPYLLPSFFSFNISTLSLGSISGSTSLLVSIYITISIFVRKGNPTGFNINTSATRLKAKR